VTPALTAEPMTAQARHSATIPAVLMPLRTFFSFFVSGRTCAGSSRGISYQELSGAAFSAAGASGSEAGSLYDGAL